MQGERGMVADWTNELENYCTVHLWNTVGCRCGWVKSYGGYGGGGEEILRQEAKYVESWPNTRLLTGLAGGDFIFQWISMVEYTPC
jgi:hypothetical protein